MNNVNLIMVEKSRASINDPYKLQVYDFKMFSNCLALLENLNNDCDELELEDGSLLTYRKLMNAVRKQLKEEGYFE